MLICLARVARIATGIVLPLTLACSCTPSKEAASPEEKLGPGAECLGHATAQRTPPADAPSSISVSHILVRHANLDRPEGATRSPEEACLRALEARSALENGETWNATVEKFSDSGISTHGELGNIVKEDVTPSFGDAAFSLQIDELSYVVESDRGFHIILRTR
jgi:hypothetical protein